MQRVWNLHRYEWISYTALQGTATVLESWVPDRICAHAVHLALSIDFFSRSGRTGQAYPGVTYTAFLIPGLVIMAMLQNAFANSSSSLINRRSRAITSSCCYRRFLTRKYSLPMYWHRSFAVSW